MKLVDRYLIGQFFRNLALVMGSLLAIYLLIDFFERVDNFLAAELGMGMAVNYLLLKIPLIIEQIMPICLLLAGIITLGLLNRHHEMMALQAAGLSTPRIIRPLLLAATTTTLLTLALSQWLLPPTMAETNRIWYEQVRQQSAKGIERHGRIYHRGAEGLYSFIPSEEDQTELHDFTYLLRDGDFRLTALITAAKASWDGNRWTLHNGQIKSGDREGREFGSEIFQQRQMELPEKPADFFLPPYALAERSLSTLWRQASSPAASPRRQEARLELHKKTSYILLGLPLLLTGIPLLLWMHRGRGRDLALAIPAAAMLAFITWGLWSVGQAMAGAAYLPPALTAWLIHLVAGGLGWYFISRNG
ncbi:LptF/LptG family permease [Desulfurivibrio sp. D14AmB]|uniref:LptF/LptG family permease n=1 Tax=Desulfurivibrio sp. D14AmB TaxID=3374370 RepID=UPI00376EB534